MYSPSEVAGMPVVLYVRSAQEDVGVSILRERGDRYVVVNTVKQAGNPHWQCYMQSQPLSWGQALMEVVRRATAAPPYVPSR